MDTKANSHIKSVEPHTFFSIHLPTIKTVLQADPCMVSLQNPSEQYKFLQELFSHERQWVVASVQIFKDLYLQNYLLFTSPTSMKNLPILHVLHRPLLLQNRACIHRQQKLPKSNPWQKLVQDTILCQDFLLKDSGDPSQLAPWRCSTVQVYSLSCSWVLMGSEQHFTRFL